MIEVLDWYCEDTGVSLPSAMEFKLLMPSNFVLDKIWKDLPVGCLELSEQLQNINDVLAILFCIISVLGTL